MGVDDEVPVRIGHLVNEVVAEDASAGDEDVQASELLHRTVHEGFHGMAIGHVAGDGHRLPSLASDLRGDRFRRFRVKVGDHHHRVLGSEAHRRRCANPSSAAGDQGGPPIESSAHVMSTSASPTVTRSAR